MSCPTCGSPDPAKRWCATPSSEPHPVRYGYIHCRQCANVRFHGLVDTISQHELWLRQAIRLADEHRAHCPGEECNIMLSCLLELLHAAGVEVPQDKVKHFV